jgi:type II secretory pathway pseudopilin PulG
MSSIKKTSQGGYLQTYIIIATILALVIFGLVYFVKDRGETARSNQAIALADQIAADNKSQDTKSGDAESGKSTGAEVKKTDTADNSDKSAAVTDNKAGTSNQDMTKTGEELPVTGPPEDIAGTILGLGVLSGSVVYYIGSRRNLSRSL